MTSPYTQHFLCRTCGEFYSLKIPLTNIKWKPLTFRLARESYELDVAAHRMDHVNDRFNKFIGAYYGKTNSNS